eukprot:TRINITY_DN55736_c0_g1_i1.p1 TRINITY_DN55736_c0_g1~~TRINITY_DN55736_c0_g1_i1.p1  ORF type:complete len:325 (-),score=49.15 TRINITY_DN55736_c0_g1_i1:173-1147(-)
MLCFRSLLLWMCLLLPPWQTGAVDTSESGNSSIQCSAAQTQCSAQYAVSGVGCCTLPDAVCCPNKQTCCPAGTTCQDSGPYLTKCIDASGGYTSGLSVCKPGPQMPLDSTKKNVIVLGDSVSIGYTTPLAGDLSDIAVVQHSPYDLWDGGVEETAYGLQCLDFFVSDPRGMLLEPDVLLFNWGLHNGAMGNSTVPGQAGNASVYLPELEKIVQRLTAKYKGLKTKLVFALTSPMLCDASADAFVSARNVVVANLMSRYGVQVIDPHSAIVDKCGSAPQQSCFGIAKCFCPHCPTAGYVWLSKMFFEPFLRSILLPSSTGESLVV